MPSWRRVHCHSSLYSLSSRRVGTLPGRAEEFGRVFPMLPKLGGLARDPQEDENVVDVVSQSLGRALRSLGNVVRADAFAVRSLPFAAVHHHEHEDGLVCGHGSYAPVGVYLHGL